MKRSGQSLTRNDVATGVESGRTWFGAYFTIEPGQTKTFSFRYLLPKSAVEAVEAGEYRLFVQKQAGTIAHGLTIDLNFDKTITAAVPGEPAEKWHDGRYEVESDLAVDREFIVNF